MQFCLCFTREGPEWNDYNNLEVFMMLLKILLLLLLSINLIKMEIKFSRNLVLYDSFWTFNIP